jgi:hypothetical protein
MRSPAARALVRRAARSICSPVCSPAPPPWRPATCCAWSPGACDLGSARRRSSRNQPHRSQLRDGEPERQTDYSCLDAGGHQHSDLVPRRRARHRWCRPAAACRADPGRRGARRLVRRRRPDGLIMPPAGPDGCGQAIATGCTEENRSMPDTITCAAELTVDRPQPALWPCSRPKVNGPGCRDGILLIPLRTEEKERVPCSSLRTQRRRSG